MIIRTPKITVRELKKKDAEVLFKIAKEPSTYKQMPDYSEGYKSPQDYLCDSSWFQDENDSENLTKGRYYAITLADSDEMIGVVARGIKELFNEIEIGYFISEKYRGNGYAVEAVKALSNWCFSVSDIEYVILTINCTNCPSNKVAEKCGFELLEKRVPVNKGRLIEKDSYFYYRKYRRS